MALTQFSKRLAHSFLSPSSQHSSSYFDSSSASSASFLEPEDIAKNLRFAGCGHIAMPHSQIVAKLLELRGDALKWNADMIRVDLLMALELEHQHRAGADQEFQQRTVILPIASRRFCRDHFVALQASKNRD